MEAVFETERLIGVVLEDRFLSDIKTFWGDEAVMKLCNGATSTEILPQVIEAYQTSHKKHGLSVYGLFEKVSGEVIGAAGFNITADLQEIELIYHFRKQSWGKGYATEAAAACVELAKKHEQVQQIVASASPANAQSLKILEKIGFDYKGLKWFEDTEQEEPYYEMRLK